jgi:hypothetical protein
MSITSFRPLLLASATVMSVFLSGCGSEQNKADAPPRPGTIAHSWYSAGVAWKAGEFEKATQYLARVASSQSDYTDRARAWLAVASAGLADGYIELSNAYEEGLKTGKATSAEFRNAMRDVRAAANSTAFQFAEVMHAITEKNKNAEFKLDFEFPPGNLDEPLQLVKVKKGLAMQAAAHESLRKAMGNRGIVRFTAAVAGSPTDPEKAKAQLASAPRDTVLTAIAKQLIAAADLYSPKKLDMPKRGNVLCTEAVEALALVPESKERKALEAKAKEALKKYKVAS